MALKDLFATKSLELLHAEAMGENRLRRVLGPVGLTSLGVGAIIGAGIFVITGRVAADDAGPGILLSFVVAGFACALAAFCYAEFASMAPVAGSAYTYAYATLGEIFAWIIGWDLILEYAMSAATVGAVWAKYLNKLLEVLQNWINATWNMSVSLKVPEYLCNDPFSHPGAWFNLPAVLILGLCTTILVIGIRESAASNTALVILKLGVVLFVIVVGVGYISTANWTEIPAEARKLPQQLAIPGEAGQQAEAEAMLLRSAEGWAHRFAVAEAVKPEVGAVTLHEKDGQRRTIANPGPALARPGWVENRTQEIRAYALALYFTQLGQKYPDVLYWQQKVREYADKLPRTDKDREVAQAVLLRAADTGEREALRRWGLLGEFGVNQALERLDDSVRSNFLPYGLSGIMMGAALVFFAFIGFDSISTHAEEAIRPQRDVPFGIIASLGLCTVLYIVMAAVISGMVPYPDIDTNAAVATAFTSRAADAGGMLNLAGGLIAAGALAGMTSVLLITFLSQSRIFLAMARDGLLPHGIFGAVHEKFRTPYRSTILTGAIMSVVAALTPIYKLEEMVNIGTFFAFAVVCAAVLILRIKRPEAHRPFRCPGVFVVAPLGILVNVMLMFFLPLDTWWRLLIWLGLGLVLYFSFGYRFSALRNGSHTNGRPAVGLEPAVSKR